MEIRKFIATTIREYLNEQQVLNENFTVYQVVLNLMIFLVIL